MTMALFSAPPSSTTHLPSLSPSPRSVGKPQLSLKPNFYISVTTSRRYPLSSVSVRSTDNGSGVAAVTVEEDKSSTEEREKVPEAPVKSEEPKEVALESNGSPPPQVAAAAPEVVKVFGDSRWVNGTWDLMQFQKDGKTNWDAVIDAEARRRKWLEDNPESSSNEDPVLFDTSIIPWWAWMKRYHLPEAELLNGRAAMIGFFMAYFVDSLTGVGLVDQMSNFFCKTLLFVAVSGVLLIRKNEDIESLKKLFEESTFYDKQWQATWQDENSSTSKKDL